MISRRLDALRYVPEAATIVMADRTRLAVHNLARVLDGAAVRLDETLQTHANTQDWHATCKIPDRIVGYAAVRTGMTRPRRDDQVADAQVGKVFRRELVVTKDSDLGTEDTERLVQIPGERVEIVDQESFDRGSVR